MVHMSNDINSSNLNEQRRKRAEEFRLNISDDGSGDVESSPAEEINSYSGDDVKEQIAKESKRSLKKKKKAEKRELKKRNKHNRRMFRWMWVVSVLLVGAAMGLVAVYMGTQM